MLKIQTLVSFSYYLFKTFKVARHSENVSRQISCLNRILWQLNSGCLVAGCCFSRQSDQETLLPGVKNNLESSKNKKSDNLSPHSSTQHASYVKDMKRSIDVPEDACVSSLSNSDNKRKKIATNQNNFLEGKEPVNDSVSPTIECEGSEKSIQEKDDKEVDAKQHKVEIERPKKYRPNYFVAIKISDPQIHQVLNEVQQHMLEQDENLKKSMIQLATLHITLMVMYIGDTETHAKAVKTLENIHQEHNDEFSKNPLVLEFKGLGHFQNRVLYAKLLSDDAYERLSALADSVRKHFAISSIPSTDSKTNFTPHLTIAKIREERQFKKRNRFPRKINPSLYKDFNDQYFGSQKVQSIQLLSMTDPKDEDGYYSGNEIYFSAFEPSVKHDSLNKMLLETQEKKKNVKEMINMLMREKLK